MDTTQQSDVHPSNDSTPQVQPLSAPALPPKKKQQEVKLNALSPYRLWPQALITSMVLISRIPLIKRLKTLRAETREMFDPHP